MNAAVAECRLCRWKATATSLELAEHLLTIHIGVIHPVARRAEPSLMNRCLAVMAEFPMEVQRDAARHVLAEEM